MITSMLDATRVDMKNPKIFAEISFVFEEFQSLRICRNTVQSQVWVVSGLDGQNQRRHRVTTLVMDHPRSEYH